MMDRKDGLMNNCISVFNKDEFGDVRVVMIDDEPWFVGRDVCVVFGDTNPSRSMGRIEDEDKSVVELDTRGGRQKLTVLSESGLYSLLFAMKPQKTNRKGVQDAYPPEMAERIDKLNRFKRWVTAEILPTIRKTGGYVNDDALFVNTYLPFADDAVKELFRLQLTTIRQLNSKIEERDKQISEQKPMVDFAKHVGSTKDLISMAQFAKLLHTEKINIGRNKLFEWMRQNGYLNSRNEPYQQYVNAGYFKVRESVKQTAYGSQVFTTTFVTGKGQIYFTEKLRKEWHPVLNVVAAAM